MLINSDEDRKELVDLITGTLGIEEGKSLPEVIAAAIQQPLNAVDKRAKEALQEALSKVKVSGLDDETIAGIKEIIAKGGAGGSGDGDDPADDGKFDLSKLSPSARAAFQKQSDALATFEKKLEKETAAREAAEAQRLATEQQGMRRYMSEETRKAAIAAGLDPTKLDFFMPWVEQSEMVRGIDGRPGQFEMKTGQEDTFGDPVYKPLTAAMGELAKSDVGKQFRPARAGTAPGAPPEGATKEYTGDRIPWSSIKDDMQKLRDTPFEQIDLEA